LLRFDLGSGDEGSDIDEPQACLRVVLVRFYARGQRPLIGAGLLPQGREVVVCHPAARRDETLQRLRIVGRLEEQKPQVFILRLL
jgi:hypothetical protein